KNKKVEWSVTDITGKTGATISSGGKVKVPSNTSVDTSFRITAKALDGSGVTATKDVYVKAVTKTLSVNLTDADFDTKNSDSQAGIKKISFNPKNKMLKNIVLSSADISSNSFYDDQTVLTAETDNAIPVEWKTSNSKIVKVNGKEKDYNSKVTLTGLKSGKAVITCKTNDGSEKSVKINVTVINPVSFVSLNMDQSKQVYAIAKGYSMKNPVVLGEGYGKPGIRKVKWDYSIYLYNRVIDSSSGDTWNKTYSAELTQEIKKSNLVSLSDSGLLKVSKDWKDGIYRISNISGDGKGNNHAEINNAYVIRVTATATDGTGFSGYKDYVVTPPIKSVECAVMDKGTKVVLSGKTMDFFVAPKDEDGNQLFMGAYNLEIINTNPKCGGVAKTSIGFFGGFSMYVPTCDVYKRVSNGTVGYYYHVGYNYVKINFNDGSGKSVRYRIMRKVQ
nr:hypothetical protein [Lachnospiraceae bacterium]